MARSPRRTGAGQAIGAQWDAIRDNYYEQMGWDVKTGKPLPETLKKLGLEHLVKDLNA